MTIKRSPSGADNFMRIKNISRSVERRLHEAGIATYAKLASLTPHGISEILGDSDGVTTKQIVKERWIEQSRDLSSRPAPAASESETVSQENLSSAKSKGLASFVVQLLVDKEGRTKHTKVMRTENGIEGEWDGWQGQRLLDFINAHAGLRPPVAETDLPAATPARQEPEARVMPEPLPGHLPKPGPAPSAKPRVAAPSQAIVIATSAGGPTFQKSASARAHARAGSVIISANQSFKVHLAIDRPEISSLKKGPLSYKANVYAKSLEGRRCQSIGEMEGQLEPTDTVPIIVDGCPLPQGLFRIQAVVDISAPTSKSKSKSPSTFQTGEKLIKMA